SEWQYQIDLHLEIVFTADKFPPGWLSIPELPPELYGFPVELLSAKEILVVLGFNTSLSSLFLSTIWSMPYLNEKNLLEQAISHALKTRKETLDLRFNI
ncbi:MAG: hypothetical protein AAGD28_27240, partial [Bacteroidota bacterium]